MRTNNVWVYITIMIIWTTVIVMSLGSPELVFGEEPQVINVAAIADWFWGLLGTVFVMRATVFRRPNEAGWGQDDAWHWVTLVVAGIWIAAMLVSIMVPAIEIGDNIQAPVATLIAPLVAAALTPYACEFLIEGFAARRGGAAAY
jgi:hypothetical protein